MGRCVYVLVEDWFDKRKLGGEDLNLRTVWSFANLNILGTNFRIWIGGT
jgi:hypothetical protein